MTNSALFEAVLREGHGDIYGDAMTSLMTGKPTYTPKEGPVETDITKVDDETKKKIWSEIGQIEAGRKSGSVADIAAAYGVSPEIAQSIVDENAEREGKMLIKGGAAGAVLGALPALFPALKGLAPKVLPTLGKYGIKLGAEALSGLMNQLGQLFGIVDEKGNPTGQGSIGQVGQVNQMASTDLALDKQKYAMFAKILQQSPEMQKQMPDEANAIVNIDKALKVYKG